ncbi:MAG: hypothetical protein OEW75_01475, partial [Cyclobacteriaceae bacterium]|nr:hypothetical protein [Cyclobacteriaceae bacterium]
KKYKTSKNSISPAFYSDSIQIEENKKGIAVLTDKTLTYKGNPIIYNPKEIKSIKKVGNHYFIKPLSQSTNYLFKSTVAFENINKLPSLQSDYAQGRPSGGNFEWFGADQQEIFSWGPSIKNLEFDGSNYNFDLNGRLVDLGNGNGKKAIVYDPNSFFRTGFITNNELVISIPGTRFRYFTIDGEYAQRSGVLPSTSYNFQNIALSLKDYKWLKNLKINPSVRFNNSSGNILPRGANYAQILGSVYRTPPTFDNANGLSRSSALNNPDSYLLNDNSVRSHAPNFADNPYGLVNTIPDNETSKRLIGTLGMDYSGIKNIELVFRGTLDNQWSQINYGMAPGYSSIAFGRLTDKNINSTFLNSTLGGKYVKHPSNYDWILEISSSFQTNFQKVFLERNDGTGFSFANFEEGKNAAFSNSLIQTLSRTSHETLINVNYNYDYFIKTNLSAKSYFSNTIVRSSPNFYPAFSLSINPGRLFDFYGIGELKTYMSIGKSIRETPLIYSDWAYLSTNLPLENYDRFYESSELFTNNTLSPETERKFETGLEMELFYYIHLDFTYFDHVTSDFIAPVINGGVFELENAAKIQNRGSAITIIYNPYWEILSSLQLNWTKSRSLVKEIYGQPSPIPLAGFNTVQTVMAPGQTYGAIYGTSYLRNAGNDIVIDNDGFPIEDATLQLIGDPTPDWIGSFTATLSYKKWNFDLLFEHKQGGDMWNGTRAMLDYLGRTQETADMRNTSNYIYEGVDLTGSPNLKSVSFSDPSLPVDQNRWTRYGWDGVGEEYIEKSTWSRLSEVSISHNWNNFFDSRFKMIKISASAYNLLTFSPYKGVIPTSSLYGYMNGSALDLFNQPGTRRYSLTLTLKF